MNTKKLLWNKFTLVLVLAAIGAAGFSLWQKGNQKSSGERYKTQAVESGAITQTVSANGTLNPVVLVSVGTQVSGTVKKLYVDFNDKVKEGEVLMELDAALYEAQSRQSEANVNSAQAALELAAANEVRSRGLYAQEYISKQELDQAVQSLKSARAQLALARAQHERDLTNLGYSVIRSPVSGVVVAREVDVGQTVAASFQTPTLFKIAQDLRRMQIDSSFAEADIGNIKEDQAVRFTVDAFPNKSFEGTVKQVRLNPTTQQNVVTYNVVVSVDNPEQILMPGMTAYVNIIVAQRKNALLVPNAALRFKPQDTAAQGERRKGKENKREGAAGTVYVLENNQLKPVNTATGITDNRYTEVLSGELKAGNQVVVEDTQLSSGANQNQLPSTFRMRMF
ncbi:MAG: efflux RND transporter periplasmic adaptor subunit [Gammaproteobacteria bacterium]|nr:efflux RND transporter periplasmic adaptor subunit [Gammaproteobacteria bacterium]